MDIIRKKELETLLNYVEDEDIKDKINEFLKCNEDISTEEFLKKIKEIKNLDSLDYKLFLLLEEFYLRFKDIEEKNDRWDW